jgi:hypothetical protein
MINQKIYPSNIVKSYWQGGFNRGVQISIIKEKKIDILTNYSTTDNTNAKETEILQKNSR